MLWQHESVKYQKKQTSQTTQDILPEAVSKIFTPQLTAVSTQEQVATSTSSDKS